MNSLLVHIARTPCMITFIPEPMSLPFSWFCVSKRKQFKKCLECFGINGFAVTTGAWLYWTPGQMSVDVADCIFLCLFISLDFDICLWSMSLHLSRCIKSKLHACKMRVYQSSSYQLLWTRETANENWKKNNQITWAKGFLSQRKTV